MDYERERVKGSVLDIGKKNKGLEIRDGEMGKEGVVSIGEDITYSRKGENEYEYDEHVVAKETVGKIKDGNNFTYSHCDVVEVEDGNDCDFGKGSKNGLLMSDDFTKSVQGSAYINGIDKGNESTNNLSCNCDCDCDCDCDFDFGCTDGERGDRLGDHNHGGIREGSISRSSSIHRSVQIINTSIVNIRSNLNRVKNIVNMSNEFRGDSVSEGTSALGSEDTSGSENSSGNDSSSDLQSNDSSIVKTVNILEEECGQKRRSKDVDLLLKKVINKKNEEKQLTTLDIINECLSIGNDYNLNNKKRHDIGTHISVLNTEMENQGGGNSSEDIPSETNHAQCCDIANGTSSLHDITSISSVSEMSNVKDTNEKDIERSSNMSENTSIFRANTYDNDRLRKQNTMDEMSSSCSVLLYNNLLKKEGDITPQGNSNARGEEEESPFPNIKRENNLNGNSSKGTINIAPKRRKFHFLEYLPQFLEQERGNRENWAKLHDTHIHIYIYIYICICLYTQHFLILAHGNGGKDNLVETEDPLKCQEGKMLTIYGLIGNSNLLLSIFLNMYYPVI
ncbi:hypothetical protein POVWA2_027150 [Plasmodium ovale wallikeri]|uniref:Uncharacterized protein n=1 Tax=Plasmodium ovale wallikeri TaxID=864142 RepID=A0A1A8YW12_PLAOA|nr:hypothetical protein POVWA1_029150 [Plasmodium ovale wallikeri]SBT35878.1 hypothetical protein POVWA2_027150 [Plasmodium ovale wallikeri]